MCICPTGEDGNKHLWVKTAQQFCHLLLQLEIECISNKL